MGVSHVGPVNPVLLEENAFHFVILHVYHRILYVLLRIPVDVIRTYFVEIIVMFLFVKIVMDCINNVPISM